MSYLGKIFTPQELATKLGLDVRTVRRYYLDLGGVRLGQRKIIFPEEDVKNAFGSIKDSHDIFG